MHTSRADHICQAIPQPDWKIETMTKIHNVLSHSEIAPIAARIESAHSSFVETLRGLSSCSEEDAVSVKNLYLKHKLAKMDPVMGRITVKHGSYLDRDVILSAIDHIRTTS
jgi:hypothetical protein